MNTTLGYIEMPIIVNSFNLTILRTVEEYIAVQQLELESKFLTGDFPHKMNFGSQA
jgi:hypothetical protein